MRVRWSIFVSSFLLIIVGIPLMVFLGVASTHAAEKMRIAVTDMDAFGVEPSLANSVSDILRTELFRTGSFEVMERSRMAKIMDEQTLQMSGAINDAQVVAIGKLLAVEMMTIGSINRLGNDLVINIRMVDVTEARVKAAETVTAHGEVQLAQATKLLASKMAQAIPMIGRIVSIRGEELIISLGRADGIKENTELKVRRYGEAFRDPESGRTLGREIVDVATLRVKRVMSDVLCVAEISDRIKPVNPTDTVVVASTDYSPSWPVGAGREGLKTPQSPGSETQLPRSPSPPAAVVSVDKAGEYIAMIHSGDTRQIKRACETIIAKRAYSPEIMQVVNDTLVGGFRQREDDKRHMDAMAWLCKVLGSSGQKDYAGTLETVVNETSNRKLKKHAEKMLGVLKR
jgi:TolB-like protein